MSDVTFFMSVYNNAEHLNEAIDSVLNQTYKDFEFLIIDDGSTDKSVEIIKSYNDPRIKFVENKINIGIPKSMNKGLKLSKGKYFINMNADDLSMHDRINKQVAFMENNPEVVVCGTWWQNFGDVEDAVPTFPTKHDSILARMLFENTIYNSTVIIRRDAIYAANQFRDESYKFAEDYEYYVRLGLMDMKLANLGEVLVKYRIHKLQTGNVHNLKMQIEVDRINKMQLSKLNLKVTDNEFEIYKMFNSWIPHNKESILKSSFFIAKLIEANKKMKIYDEEELLKEVAARWFQICNNSTHNGFWILKEFYKNPLSRVAYLPLKKKIKFFIKSLLSYEKK